MWLGTNQAIHRHKIGMDFVATVAFDLSVIRREVRQEVNRHRTPQSIPNLKEVFEHVVGWKEIRDILQFGLDR